MREPGPGGQVRLPRSAARARENRWSWLCVGAAAQGAERRVGAPRWAPGLSAMSARSSSSLFASSVVGAAPRSRASKRARAYAASSSRVDGSGTFLGAAGHRLPAGDSTRAGRELPPSARRRARPERPHRGGHAAGNTLTPRGPSSQPASPQLPTPYGRVGSASTRANSPSVTYSATARSAMTGTLPRPIANTTPLARVCEDPALAAGASRAPVTGPRGSASHNRQCRAPCSHRRPALPYRDQPRVRSPPACIAPGGTRRGPGVKRRWPARGAERVPNHVPRPAILT